MASRRLILGLLSARPAPVSVGSRLVANNIFAVSFSNDSSKPNLYPDNGPNYPPRTSSYSGTTTNYPPKPNPYPGPPASRSANSNPGKPVAFPTTSSTVLASSNPMGSRNDVDGDPNSNWSQSFHGLSTKPFPKETADILLAEVDPNDIEIKPDGLPYLPEIKYRRILNRAFGPGGWGLAPRGEHSVSPKTISREYALICHGRFVAQARGEQDYFDPDGLATAAEGCKSNALMRCCKDLGIASELWDPAFIRKFKQEKCVEVMATHVLTGKRKKLWRLKKEELLYPYKEVK